MFRIYHRQRDSSIDEWKIAQIFLGGRRMVQEWAFFVDGAVVS